MKYSVLLLMLLAVGGFVGFWCLVVKLISLVTWQPLARHFGVVERPPGTQVGLGQARLG